MVKENNTFRKTLEHSRHLDLLKKVKTLDTRVKEPLKGQLELAKRLREKGYSFAEISAWLADNGIAVHPSSICRALKGVAK